jgi:hypothetical protein
MFTSVVASSLPVAYTDLPFTTASYLPFHSSSASSSSSSSLQLIAWSMETPIM